jgi:hypothetical protein
VRVAHGLGEVVGLGLRNLAHCPVELNLMPDSTLRWQSFNQKKPYFLATFCSLVLMAFAVGYLFEKLSGVKQNQLSELQQTIEPLKNQETQFKRVHGELKRTQEHLEQITTWLDDRYYWAEILQQLRDALIRAEDNSKRRLGTDTGVWIEQLTSTTPSSGLSANNLMGETAPAPRATPVGEMTESQRLFYERYGIPASGPPPAESGLPPGEAMAVTPDGSPEAAPAGNPGEIASLTLHCRAVDLTNVTPDANITVAYALENELKTSALFNPTNTLLSPQLNVDGTSGTVTFEVKLALNRPIKL